MHFATIDGRKDNKAKDSPRKKMVNFDLPKITRSPRGTSAASTPG